MDGSRKRAWTPAEDEKLRTAVAVGPVKWASVAQAVGTDKFKVTYTNTEEFKAVDDSAMNPLGIKW